MRSKSACKQGDDHVGGRRNSRLQMKLGIKDRQKDPSLYLFKGDPLLKNLESDPRHKAFLRKMNLPE